MVGLCWGPGGIVGTGRDEVLELVEVTINWQSSRLPLLRGCPFPPLVLEGGRKQEFEVESSEGTGPSRWYLNGDQEKERGTRSMEVQCKGWSPGSLMTWMDPGYFASNLLCALGQSRPSLGFCQSTTAHTGQRRLRTDRRPSSVGPHTFSPTSQPNSASIPQKEAGDFMDRKSPGFITEGCQKGDLGPQAINETQKSIT